MKKEIKNLLSVYETCGALNISRRMIYLWLKDGLPFAQVGKKKMFDLQEVKEWIKQQDYKKYKKYRVGESRAFKEYNPIIKSENIESDGVDSPVLENLPVAEDLDITDINTFDKQIKRIFNLENTIYKMINSAAKDGDAAEIQRLLMSYQSAFTQIRDSIKDSINIKKELGQLIDSGIAESMLKALALCFKHSLIQIPSPLAQSIMALLINEKIVMDSSRYSAIERMITDKINESVQEVLQAIVNKFTELQIKNNTEVNQ